MPTHTVDLLHPDHKALISAFVDTIGTPIVADDAQGNIIHLNAAFTRTFGYTQQDVPNLHDWWPRAYPDPNYRAWVIAEWQKRLTAVKNSKKPFDPMKIQIVTKHGESRTVIVSGSFLEKISDALTIVTFNDITEQEQAQQALKASNQQLDFALAGSALGLWDCDLSNGQVIYDQRWCSIVGYHVEEIEPSLETWQALIHPDDRSHVDDAIHAHLRGETELYQTEHRLKHKSGHWVWVLAKGKIVTRDPDGNPVRVTGTHVDISAQKRLSSEGLDLLRRVELLMHDVAHHVAPTPRTPINTQSNAPSSTALSTELSTRLSTLTRRQREILALVSQGFRSSEIAEQLNIATATVVTHRRDMMRKLGTRTSAELARYAIQLTQP